MTSRRLLLLIAAASVAIAIALYGNVLNGDFVYDDFEYVIDNPVVRDRANLFMSDPRQVGYLTFSLNYAVHGEHTFGYHLVNVLIHAGNSFLVFLLAGTFLCRVSGREALEKRHLLIAALAASLFLVHPAQTQAVSYITQRFTSLAAFFYLLAVFLYLRARILLDGGQQQDRGYVLYALAILSAILAMRTKEISFTIPFAVALAELVLFKGSLLGRRRFIYLVPFGALLLLIPLALLGPELGLLGGSEGIAETTRQEKVFDLKFRSPFEYLLTQFRVIVIYLRLIVLPVGQSVVYDLRASRSLLEPAVILSLLFLLMLAAAGWRLWQWGLRKGGDDGAAGMLAAAGVAWYFLTISVESSIIPIKDLIFEHRMYLPNAGMFSALAAGMISLVYRLAPMGKKEHAARLVFLICIPLAVTTVVRNDVWRTEIKLWDDVVRKAPAKPIGYNNRGTAYAKRLQYEKALADLDVVISFFPRIVDRLPDWEHSDLVPPNMSKTYNTRGQIYLALGDAVRAKQDFKRAQQIFMPDIDLERSLRLGDLYYKKGAYAHAIQEFSRALERDPENFDALNNRGNAYSQSGKYTDAIRDFDQVIGLDPDFVLAYYNRGIAYAWRDDRKQALRDLDFACAAGFQPACDSIEIVKRGEK